MTPWWDTRKEKEKEKENAYKSSVSMCVVIMSMYDRNRFGDIVHSGYSIGD